MRVESSRRHSQSRTALLQKAMKTYALNIRNRAHPQIPNCVHISNSLRTMKDIACTTFQAPSSPYSSLSFCTFRHDLES